MRLVPEDTVGCIQFYQTHHTPWSANAQAIGTSSAQVTALAAKTAAARDAYAEQYAAYQAARNATQKLRHALAAMSEAGAGIIKQIRARAATDGDNVYALASLPAPATPSRIGAPGTPTDFKATLRADGALKLTWKCPNPANAQGTMYQIERRVGDGPLVPVGLAGKRAFLDSTLPAGAASITYQIRAMRSTAVGTAAQFTVLLGVRGAISATIQTRRAA